MMNDRLFETDRLLSMQHLYRQNAQPQGAPVGGANPGGQAGAPFIASHEMLHERSDTGTEMPRDSSSGDVFTSAGRVNDH